MLSGHKKYKHTFTNVRAHLSHVVMIIRDLLVILIEKVTFLPRGIVFTEYKKWISIEDVVVCKVYFLVWKSKI